MERTSTSREDETMSRKVVRVGTSLALGLLSIALLLAPATRTDSQAQLAVTISPQVPSDIPAPITPQSAAIFAWQEFIALNWPAVAQTGALNTRDVPNTGAKFGDPGYTGPLVWPSRTGTTRRRNTSTAPDRSARPAA
jgi:hypothetical protein